MHRQTNHLIGNLCCHRQVLWCSTWQTTIGAKRTDKRIEVSTAEYIFLFHFEIKLVTSLTKLLCENNYNCDVLQAYHQRSEPQEHRVKHRDIFEPLSDG